MPAKFQKKCDIQLGVGLSREYLGWTAAGIKPASDKLRLLFVGRLLEWKGVELALRALAEVRERGSDVRLTIIGEGPARGALQQVTTRLGLGESVQWRDWVPQCKLETVYAEHDVLLFPSMRDSGGMAVLEALAHGLPVICTDLGGPGVIVNQRCGRVVGTNARNTSEVVTQLADAIHELGRDRTLLRKLARAARARAWDFDFRQVVRKVHPIEADSSQRILAQVSA